MAELEDIARGLQADRIAEVFGAKEVLAWEAEDGAWIGFRGDALRIERVITNEALDAIGNVRNVHHDLDARIQRAAGLDVRVTRESWGYDMRGGIGQTLETPTAHFSQALDTVAGAVGERLGSEAKATLLPLEGEPWRPGGVLRYFNARTGRQNNSGTPRFLVEVRVRADALDGRGEGTVIVPGVDVCRLAPHIEQTRGPVLGRFDDGTEFLVSHSFDPAPYLGVDPRPWVEERIGRLAPREAAKLVGECGGWIYPSLAVGKFASTTFGPLAMFAGTDIVIDNLAPRRGRGRWVVSLYDTDTWTPNTTDILGLGAHVLYEQLTGQAEYSVYTYAAVNHMWILGPPVKTGGPAGPDARVLKSADDLRRALKRRYRIWNEALEGDEVLTLIEQATHGAYAREAHRYPYLEAKLNARLAPSGWRLAIVADSWQTEAEEFLRAVGYKGDLIVVDDPPGTDPGAGWHLAADPAAAYEHAMTILKTVRRL